MFLFKKNKIMADLKDIDEIVAELQKIRGIDLSSTSLKMITLSYLLYACNTFDVMYQNENGYNQRINSGCVIFCQRGTGKSRALKILKKIFSCVEEERKKRYEKALEFKIGYKYDPNSMNNAEKEIKKQFQAECGSEPLQTYQNAITSKELCATYQKIKKYRVNNMLFDIDEVGDRVFADAFSNSPSTSSKDFLNAINQLFDGKCNMGLSHTAAQEGITSQENVGANFVLVSTAAFLKNKSVQAKFKSAFESGIARRLLYLNCPPLDLSHSDRRRLNPNFTRFEEKIKKIFSQPDIQFKKIKVSESLWKVLEQDGSGCGISIAEEYLLLLFCTALAVWTEDEEIQRYHWQYMVDLYNEIRNLSQDVIKSETSYFDRIVIFMQEYIENNHTDKVPKHLIRDYCAREKICAEDKFSKWFARTIVDNCETNSSKYMIEDNKLYAWLQKNYAYKK